MTTFNLSNRSVISSLALAVGAMLFASWIAAANAATCRSACNQIRRACVSSAKSSRDVARYECNIDHGSCDDACDANDDGLNNIADAIYVLSNLFSMGPNPPSPFPDCGPDPTGDGIRCTAFAPC